MDITLLHSPLILSIRSVLYQKTQQIIKWQNWVTYHPTSLNNKQHQLALTHAGYKIYVTKKHHSFNFNYIKAGSVALFVMTAGSAYAQKSELTDTLPKSDDVNLQKLLTYYQPNPDIKTLNELTAVVTDDTTNTTEKLAAVQATYENAIQAPRCEGVWIHPQQANNINTQPMGNANQVSSDTSNNVVDNNVLDSNANVNINGNNNDVNKVAQGALHALADFGYYDNKNYAELSGNVVIKQNGQIINADKVSVDLTNNMASAEGQVLFSDFNANKKGNANTQLSNLSSSNQGGFISVSDKLSFNTQTKQAQASGVAFASVAMQAHGYAGQLSKPNGTQYKLEEVMFTTCAPTNKKWHLDAKSIDLDTESGRGVARNTTLNIANIPVVYLPYFNFPIDDRRASGFLIPTASFDTEQGLEVEIPYYLNLAPNYDATISARVFSKHNPMLASEFRYLNNYGEGTILGTFLPKDKQYNDQNRSSLSYKHKWLSQNTPNLSAAAEYNYVSDADYSNDFDALDINENNANLPRQVQVNYFNDYVDAELKVATYQNLDATDIFGNPIKDVNRPYDKLPQLTVNYKLPWLTEANKYWQNLQLKGTHDSGYFKQNINDQSGLEKSGFRTYNQLTASYPFNNTWGYITPSVGFGHIYASYDEDSLQANNLTNKNGSQSVFVPKASIDAGLNLYKKGAPFNWLTSGNGYQVLSPRLKYTYSPFKDQNSIPNFSTSVASVGYEQLYANSWFLGHDRLQDLHAITPGFNYRYINANGQTRFNASMAQQFYIDKGRVSLDDITNEADNLKLFNERSSGLVTTLSAKPSDKVWIDTNAALTHGNDLNFFSSQIRYQPNDASLLSFGIIERKENKNTNQLPLSALTASMVMPVTNKWRLMAQGQYDYENNRALESLVGLDYEDCCIGFSVYGHRYYNELNLNDEPTDSIMGELRFKGLSSGGKLVRLLSDRIYGFNPTQNAWKQP